GVTGGSYGAMNGVVDEVAVFNRALSALEVSQIYSASSSGMCSTISVLIDIKPGSYPNSINLGSGGTVPVAIISTPTFDASTVIPTTITLAGATVKFRGN